MAIELVRFEPTSLNAIRIRIAAVSPAALADVIHKRFAGVNNYFSHELAVIDCEEVTQWPTYVDWGGIIALFRRVGLQPIGITHLPPELENTIARYPLALLRSLQGDVVDGSSFSSKPEAQEVQADHETTQEKATLATIVDRPVRSGQQIYVPHGDLILLNSVNPGGEVIADGHIHCWGRLAGRAAAGASGNTNARIFARHFSPELVSIAGVFKTFEKGVPHELTEHPIQVRLIEANGKLHFEPIS